MDGRSLWLSFAGDPDANGVLSSQPGAAPQVPRPRPPAPTARFIHRRPVSPKRSAHRMRPRISPARGRTRDEKPRRHPERSGGFAQRSRRAESARQRRGGGGRRNPDCNGRRRSGEIRAPSLPPPPPTFYNQRLPRSPIGVSRTRLFASLRSQSLPELRSA